MQISILSAQATTQNNSKGKPMQVLEVAYKNLTFQGKVESKKLFDFGVQKDAFKTLATAQIGQVYEINVVKNEAGYNDWVKVEKSDGAQTASQMGASVPSGNVSRGAATGASSATPASKGTWETPEERAKKQIYIVRQSSLTAAISTLTAGRKTELKPEDVIELASRYEAFVFGNGDVHNVVAQDVVAVPGFEDLESDLPF